MISDIDFLIDFFNKYTYTTIDKEIDEQDEPASSPSSGGGSIPKWSDTYQLKRGKANMLGLAGEKHNTGLTRGAANQIY